MFSSIKLGKKDKLYFAFLLIGFLIKYNYIMLYIFNSPVKIGLILKNIFFI